MTFDLVSRAAVMDAACNAVADAWERKNVSVAGALIDSINGVPAATSRADEVRGIAAALVRNHATRLGLDPFATDMIARCIEAIET